MNVCSVTKTDPRRYTSGRIKSLIYIASVADLKHANGQYCVFDRIQDAIIANAQPV